MRFNNLIAIVAFAFSAALSAIFAFSPTAGAQFPEPLIVFEDSGRTGTFCSYGVSEDLMENPYIAIVRTGNGAYYFYPRGLNEAGIESLKAINPGTPVRFSYIVEYYLEEISGEMVTYVGLTGITETGPAGDATVCRNLEDIQTNAYAADKVPGHFCGFKPGTVSSAGTVSIMTGKGIFAVTPKLQAPDKLEALSGLAPGTPIDYDMEVEIVMVPSDKAPDSPPTVFLSGYETAGEPVSGTCSASAQ
ncbi:MAG: hypothetical protein LBT40_18200 [Deltaproteobacteria bacterium]|jgi:hypothetical protein|nr:hypothetical protein [Deltaproteobacteria bacterium]